MSWLVDFMLSSIPTWAWIVIAGVAIGACWRAFGWQGVVGGLAAIVTLGAYRQGWRDRDKGKAPLVPVPRPVQDRRKAKTVVDFLKEWQSGTGGQR